MTKAEAIHSLKALYRVANMADSDIDPRREDWTHPMMAGDFCRALDHAFRALRDCDVITPDELQGIYDTL